MVDVRSLQKAVERRAKQLRDEAVRQVVEETSDAAPDRSGALRASIKSTPYEKRNIYGATIFSKLKYAGFTDAGTRAHLIRARRSRLLVFDGPGGDVFARQVRHPGTKGTNWFGSKARSGTNTVMQRRWRTALRGAAR